MLRVGSGGLLCLWCGCLWIWLLILHWCTRWSIWVRKPILLVKATSITIWTKHPLLLLWIHHILSRILTSHLIWISLLSTIMHRSIRLLWSHLTLHIPLSRRHSPELMTRWHSLIKNVSWWGRCLPRRP